MSDEKQDANDWSRSGGPFRAEDAESMGPDPSEPLDDAWRTVREWGAATGADWLTSDPPKRRYLLTRPDDKGKDRGAVPLGRVGMLAAAGGAGKSWVLCQLALSVATGAKWLGTYTVPERGRVLLALAEEEAEEMQRRLHYAARELALTPIECDRARDQIVALPLAGRGVALTYSVEELRAMDERKPLPGELLKTPFADELCARLNTPGDDWRLIVLDPLSRFAGPDVEVDNAQATRFVQTLESLTHTRGHPTVIVAHHTTKGSRADATTGASAIAARGSSALTDGVRWQGNLVTPQHAPLPGFLWFEVTKGNYTVEQTPLMLKRGEHGELRTPTRDEREAYYAAKKEAKRKAKAKNDDATKPSKGKPVGFSDLGR